MDNPAVAIQVGAVSFVDEGVNAVLDIFEERAAACGWRRRRGAAARADAR